MLSDQGADLVMAEIQDLTFKVMCPDYYMSHEPAMANAMLNHLYELHKRRDFDVFCDVEEELSLNDPLYVTFCELHNGHWEDDDA